MGFRSVNNESRNFASLLRQHAWAGGLAVLCLLLALVGREATELFRFDWELTRSGQWWRVLSGHLVHLGWSHTLMNVAALLLMSVLFAGQLSRWSWSLVVLVSATGVATGLVCFGPQLDWYVGLSGVLHGIFAAGLMSAWGRRPVESSLLAAALVAKLIYENTQGALPGSETTAGGPVIVEAHLYGAVTGLFVAVAIVLLGKIRTKARSQVQ